MAKRRSLSERIEQASEVLDELSHVGDMLSSSFDNKELAFKFLEVLDRLISVEFGNLRAGYQIQLTLININQYQLISININ